MESLKFKNGKFKIMQIADTQEKAAVNPDTVSLITSAVEKEKPDLVVFTGDQIMGYSATFKTKTRDKVRKTLFDLTKPISDKGIPFCATFGNHDDNCGVSNKEQMETIYKSLPGFYYGRMMGDDDPGSYSIQIKDSAGEKNIFNLYLVDSNSYDENGGYAPVNKKQIENYRNEREKIKKENGKYLPSLVFQHIPVCEIYDVITRTDKGTKGAVEAFRTHKNEFYVLDKENAAEGEFMHENPASPDRNEGQFEALKEKGEVLGVFFGHDHINSFVREKDGVKLGYTQGCGFNTYGPGNKRGVRIFELEENNLGEFSTYTVTMKDLNEDFRAHYPLYDFVLSHAPSSVEQAKKMIKRALPYIGAAAVVTIGAVRKLKR